MSATAQGEMRLSSLLDERDQTTKLHEELLARIATNQDKLPDEVQKEQIKMYRERATALDSEIVSLNDAVEADRRAAEASQQIRRALAGSAEGVDEDGDGIVYRSFQAYARDEILARSVSSSGELAKVASGWGGSEAVEAARNRLQLLKRTPANTLSSDVAGLQPPQYLAQIFQVIDTSRPLVASAARATLDRLTLTYPKIVSRPVVAVQASEKTEGGNTKLQVDMETTTATTYIGGGDISWQAAQFSTPNAIELWFRIVTSDYALKTEQDAAQALQHSGFTYNISSTLASNADFPTTLAGLAAGAGDVYANSGRIADTIYMAPDQLYRIAALASTSSASFINAGSLNLSAQGGTLAGLNVVVSRGMDAGVVVVGDSQGLLVAENAGAPVELRVTEPAIGGFEVGLIGAFEAVVVDAGAFAMITTAS